jgi:hypothetical protein
MFKNIHIDEREGIQTLSWSKFFQITQYPDSTFYFLKQRSVDQYK